MNDHIDGPSTAYAMLNDSRKDSAKLRFGPSRSPINLFLQTVRVCRVAQSSVFVPADRTITTIVTVWYKEKSPNKKSAVRREKRIP